MVVDDYVLIYVETRKESKCYKVPIKNIDLNNINFLKRFLDENKNFIICKDIYFDVENNSFYKRYICYETTKIKYEEIK